MTELEYGSPEDLARRHKTVEVTIIVRIETPWADGNRPDEIAEDIEVNNGSFEDFIGERVRDWCQLSEDDTVKVVTVKAEGRDS